MVLIANSNSQGRISSEEILNSEQLTQVNEDFAKSEIQTVPDDIKSVYVLQSEFALFDERIETTPIVIGSDEATTCAICIFSGEGLHLVAHVDSNSSQELDVMLQKFRGRISSAINVYIVGAYSDEKNTGIGVVRNVLEQLNSEVELQFQISLACVGDVNTNKDGSPNKTSLAIELPSQKVFAAQFTNKGPEIIRRRASFWVGGERERNIYDTEEAQIQVLSYKVNLSWRRANYCRWVLQLDDQSMLEVTSTSPQHEAPDYTQGLREVFRWLLANNGEGVEGEMMKFNWLQDQGWIRVRNDVQQQDAASFVMAQT